MMRALKCSISFPCLIFLPSLPVSSDVSKPQLALRNRMDRSSHSVQMISNVSQANAYSEAAPLQPPWVLMMNSALESSALSTVLAYLLIDVVATCTILGTLVLLRIQVAADFAVALGLSKAVRGPRLAFDASIAAVLTRRYPSLKAVKISRCFDEFAASLVVLRQSFEEGFEQGRAKSVRGSVAPPLSPSGRAGKLAAATRAARKLASDYGLAYMAAKNAAALVSILLIVGALRSGGPAKAATAALLRMLRVDAKAGLFAGQLAFAVTMHYALFPLVVLGAAALGPRIPLSRGAKLVNVAVHSEK